MVPIQLHAGFIIDKSSTKSGVQKLPSKLEQNRSEEGPHFPLPKSESATAGPVSEIVDAAREAYGVRQWSNGYFDVGANGNVVVNAPTRNGTQSVDLLEIIDGLQERDISMPVMLRFANLVEDRVRLLNLAFQNAFAESNYTGQYRGVFPIKVNQQRHVIQEITRVGEEFGHGLEAGSKAELLIAMSHLKARESIIVCNGYKDAEFVDLGLQAQRMGFKCFFVIETSEELEVILRQAEQWNLEPKIGIRVKLSTKVEGHWSGDSGDRSLFGLTTRQLIEAVDLLRDAGKLGCLQMLHFHLGSQIPNIRNIRDGVKEACRIYLELYREGAPLGYFNIGGGLAIDYDGTASNNSHSRNYDLEEYCMDVVEAIMQSFDPHGVPHPTIISESGRWTVAPMSVLLFNILSVANFDPAPLPDKYPENLCEPVRDLIYTLEHINPRRLQEYFNDAIYYRDLVRQNFKIGKINLRERALGENICLTILKRVAELLPTIQRPPADLLNVPDSLSDIYYGNFSVFQSLPDAWAINQVFPVMPLHRLNEPATRNAIIADLTCDCDGKLDRFTSNGESRQTIMLHEMNAGEEYYLGVFLVGAYQETLGDLHNLFGDNNVASVRITDEGKLEFVEEIEGDTISDVLSYVEYDPQELQVRFRATAERAVQDGMITVAERQQILSLFRDSLAGYTYFEG